MTTPLRCECEHISHTEPSKFTPKGDVGHAYGDTFGSLARVKTSYGTFSVCEDCADDCVAEEIQ